MASLEELKTEFDPFLKANTDSEISEREVGGKSQHVIRRPWGDNSLLFVLPDDPRPLSDVLNTVVLPVRLSAIYHIDSRDLEIIWTAFRPTTQISEFTERKFNFSFQDAEYLCEYGRSSDRLLTISKAVSFVRGSQTGYRNLQSFKMLEAQGDDTRNVSQPMSFWIRSIDWDEDKVLDFVYHLNFFMTYYDTISPIIIIHGLPEEKSAIPQTRFVADKYPATIKAREIDVNLLHFWLAAKSGDTARSFLYYYRILEYVSVHYLTSSVRNAIRKMLARPNVLDDIPLVIEELVVATQSTRQEENQRMENMLRDIVDPKLIWREVQGNIDAFNSPTIFDGGFNLGALVARQTSEDQFCQQWSSGFSAKLRDIRNALSHGRDMRTAAVIAPTHRNFTLLRPWVTLICVAAGETMIYGDAL